MIIKDIERLRLPCEKATTEEAKSIVEKLEKALTWSAQEGQPGWGLSAPQIGIQKNVAIVRINEKNLKCHLNLVNCHIEKGYDLSLFDGEGCLSFPGEYAKTHRYKEIYVVDNLVEPYRFIAKGLISTVVQHELDHLQGKLLPDYKLKD